MTTVTPHIPGLRWQTTLADGSILRILQAVRHGNAHYYLTQDHRPIGPATFTSTNAALAYAYAEWVPRQPDTKAVAP